MLISILLLSTAVLSLAVAAAYLWADRRGLRERLGSVSAELAACTDTRTRLTDENRNLLVQLERSAARCEEADRRLEDARAQFAAAQQQARETFAALAGEALTKANEELIKRAAETFDGRSKLDAATWEKRQQSVDAIVKPIRESLDRHQQAVAQIEKQREGAYHGLRQQIVSMQEAQLRLQGETQSLVTALRRAEVRGRWGEVQLRRVAELAGMIPHCDFEEQVVVRGGSGGDSVLKPDMVIRLPAGRTIAVDAKCPMVAFLDALQCDDDQQRAECFKRHLGHIEQKVRDLAGKRYQDQFDRSPDFVVLFIPGEGFLQAAAQLAPDLIERAMNLGVVIATPTTLVSLLKAVAMGWREEQVAESAKQIRDLGVELHKRIADAVEHLQKLGRSLESTVKSYNGLVGSFESRVLPGARRFKELGADSPKELPAEGESKEIEVAVRETKAAPV